MSNPPASDLAGNKTGDGTHTYQWDGEDRLLSVDGGSTETQVYNALGQQVQVNWAGGAWNVLFDPTGQWVGRNTAGHWDVGGVFHLGRRQFGIYIDQFYGIHENVLGSSDSSTNAAGGETGQSLFYPWGQTWSLGSAAWNFSAFEYGSPAPILYPTLFRTYNPALGRWMSPDPLGGDVTNPQSLNRYGYVTNNPTTLTDPLGLYPSDSSNPASLCNDPKYYWSHADCDGPPPDQCDTAIWAGPCDLQGPPWGGPGDSSTGRSTTSAPPAGEPPMKGGPSGNPWVSPTLTPPESVCSKYGIPNLGGLGNTNMPCFYILVTTSATFGGDSPSVPRSGPRVGNAGIVPTHKYWDFIGCEISALSFLPGSDTGGFLAVMNLAMFALRAKSAVFPIAAAGADLATAIAIRETCVHEVYGPGHY